MDHSAFIRLRPGAKTAVLFVHGILGSPRHFDLLLPRVPEDWSVCCLLLDGHGKGVPEFSRSSMAVWKRQVNETVKALLSAHEQILVVGHSMGTLFAIREAVENCEKVRGIFLLAAPLRIFLRLRLLPQLFRVWLGKPKAGDPVSQAFIEACSIRQDWRIWRYLGWIPRFWELLVEIRQTRKLLPKLQVPCMACQSRHDEMVSLRALKELLPCAEVTVLEDSNHFYYSQEDQEILLDAFSRFCRKMEH